MVARVSTVAFQGIEGVPVEVQVMISPGKVLMHIVGLPDKARGGKPRTGAGSPSRLRLSLPPKKVTVNLAPADLPKEGSHFDLPIALGLMAALGAIPADALAAYTVIGELNLDGTIAPVAGALPAAIAANAIGKGLICPAESGPEAAWAGAEIDILAPRSLIALANHFRGTQVLSRPEPSIRASAATFPDLADIKGRRAPSGRWRWRRLAGIICCSSALPVPASRCWRRACRPILPPLSTAELLEVSMIHSVAGPALGRKALRPPALSHAASFRHHGGAGRRRLACPDPVRHRLPITASRFSTSFRSFRRRRWMPCASRWSPVNVSSPGPIIGFPIRPASSWLQR